MKYKVGDKVKVIRVDIHFAPERTIGKIGEIIEVDEKYKEYKLYFKKENMNWRYNERELELVEEQNQFKKGDKVRVNKNGKLGIISNDLEIIPDYSKKGILNQNYRVEYFGNNLGDYDYYSCLELRLVERKQLILDEVEKKYLKAVIKPFKKHVNYIEKHKNEYEHRAYIKINIKNKKLTSENINLPYFEEDSMYKNMEVNKKYNLNELDLI